MINKIKDQYNSLYKNNEIIFGEGKPVSAVVNLYKYIKSGSVLDVGGGDGRNSLYIVNKGFDVTAIDLSEVGLEKIKEVNKEIKTKVSDITKEIIESEYDVIINTFVLHHINKIDAKKIILDMQNHTAKNGFNILVTFSNSGDLYGRNKNSERFYPSEKLVRELYSDWDIKELNIYETTTFARDKKGNRMKNHVVSLIANKTSLFFQE